MATKKTETKPQLSPQKGRKPFTDEDASDINFFKEDVEAMDRQCEESEKLYTEIHDLFASTSGGDYVPQRNLRDISELTKSLTATRSLCIQAVTSRVSIKKTISDIVAKRKGVDSETDAAAETARRIVEAINANTVAAAVSKAIETSDGGKYVPPAVNQRDTSTESDKAKLDNALERALKRGDITMTKNDKAIAISKFVVPKYDQKSKKVVAVDSRSGKIVKDYPTERLPGGNVSSVESDKVRLDSGITVGFYGETGGN